MDSRGSPARFRPPCARLPPLAPWAVEACPSLPRAAPPLPSISAASRPTLPYVDPAPSPAATALAPMADMWQRLLAEHVPDRQGRCVACQWQTRAADRWPCTVYDLAAAAQRVATTSSAPGR